MNDPPTTGPAANHTDRHRGEEALRRSEARYRALVEATSQAVWSWTPEEANGDFEHTQRWWEELTGQTRDQQTGSHTAWLDVVHPDDREAAGAAWATSIATGVPYDVEYRVRARNGGWRHIKARGVPIPGPDGRPREWVGTLHDVTEQRSAERQASHAAAANAKFRTVFEQGTQFAGILSLDGVVVEANRLSLSACGFDRDQVIGRPFWECGWWNRSPALVEMVRAACAGAADGRPFRTESAYFVADGSERVVDLTIAPVTDDDGRVLFVSCAGTDVTDRKTAEAVKARLAAIVESSDDAIVSKSLDGVIRTWNSGAERLFGYTPDEAVGRHITLIIPADRHEEEREILRRLRNGERVDHFETVRVAKDGRQISISLTVSPLRDGAGRVVGASKVARDVTERRRADEALREADRKKDEFIALLAHELRNPLAPIRNGLQVLRMADDRASRDRAREMMDRQLSHMVRLVDDLLDVSRVNQRKMELRRAPVLLADVVGSAVETARPQIDEAGHDLTVTLPGSPVHLDADLTRLAQVFSNLLTNSAKYTERGGRIWLSAERRGAAVAVTVRDTGIGIPAESLGKIFDMFSQVDRSVERSTGGLGIGLALVKGLVEMHGGTVTAASGGQGRGSAFTVTLPVLVDRPGPAAAAPEAARPAPPSRRILVADDNRDGADSLAMMLGLMGNEVRTANDGLAAVEQAGAFRPEVILMDVGMPRLNGLEATRRIREQPWGRGVAIVALTGWGQDTDRERSREAGCDGHMIKPVDLSDLERLLRELGRT